MLRRLVLALFASLLWIPAALAGVNVNTASQSELQSLPGIGPSKASAIIEYRNNNGPFASCAALDAVPGIGPATLANITPLCEVGDGKTAAAPASNGDGEAAPAKASSGSSGAGKVNINTATAAQLQTLSGIGPSKAAAIVADRDAKGAFASCSDLQRVTGIGPATVAALGDSCTTE